MRAASGGALAVASPVEPGQEVTGRLVELADVVEQHCRCRLEIGRELFGEPRALGEAIAARGDLIGFGRGLPCGDLDFRCQRTGLNSMPKRPLHSQRHF